MSPAACSACLVGDGVHIVAVRCLVEAGVGGVERDDGGESHDEVGLWHCSGPLEFVGVVGGVVEKLSMDSGEGGVGRLVGAEGWLGDQLTSLTGPSPETADACEVMGRTFHNHMFIGIK